MLIRSEGFHAIGYMEDKAPSQPGHGSGQGARPAHARAPRLPAIPGLSALVAQMAQGRQEALAALYDQTSPMLNGLLQRMLNRTEDAEEVLLDVYMKAWKNAATYSETRGSVQSWLVIMARNSAIDRIRQHRAMPRVVDLDSEPAQEPESPDASPEAQTAMTQRRQRVQQLLKELPEEQREAIVLAFFAGLTHAELAERLGQPLGTIKSRIRMGLMRLRSVLEEAGAYD
jgi:RNA polymerase sigma-70 factor (ECF subfamily)